MPGTGTCQAFAVTVGGVTFQGKQDTTIPGNQVTGTIQVRGFFIEFDVDPNTFTVTNDTLTGRDLGRPDKDLPMDAPQEV